MNAYELMLRRQVYERKARRAGRRSSPRRRRGRLRRLTHKDRVARAARGGTPR